MRIDLCLAALAQAVAQKGGIAPASAAPLLEQGVLSIRPARMHDLDRPWYAFWLRELGRLDGCMRATWSSSALLQALFEADKLHPEKMIALEGRWSDNLAAFLVAAKIEPVSFAYTVDAICIRATDKTNGDLDVAWDRLKPGGLLILIVDFAFWGVSDGPAWDRLRISAFIAALEERGFVCEAPDFSLGDHPLDWFVSPPPGSTSGSALAAFSVSAPALRAQCGGAFVTPFLIKATRPSV